MVKSLTISVKGEQFTAKPGDLLLDAALLNGVELPHDCRSGHCGTCSVSVKRGITMGGEEGRRGCIRACQARVFSDLEVEVEDLPAACRVAGELTRIRDLADGIVELTIQPETHFERLPGQYCRVQFQGFPQRSFSPTACLTSGRFGGALHFHVKRVRGGRVTPQLGTEIAPGHRVRIEGPFGTAYHRPGMTNRLVLVGSGTGFAPIWAVASAALLENPEREIVLVAGSRDPRSFYMTRAFGVAAKYSNTSIIPTVERISVSGNIIAQGTPADHLPAINADDIVYAAGSPKVVAQVAAVAQAAGADFFADPFEASTGPTTTWSGTGLFRHVGRLMPLARKTAA